MITFSCFWGGIRNVWRNRALVLLLFSFKLMFALFLTMPAYVMFSSTFSQSVYAGNFVEWLDITQIFDFLCKWKSTIGIYWISIFLTLVFVALFYVFFSGGLWGGLLAGQKKEREKFSVRVFFGDCGQHFGSFFKIFLISLVFYVLGFLISLFFSWLLDSIVGVGASVKVKLWLLGLKALGLILFFILANMISDYMRIYYLVTKKNRLIEILRETFGFLNRNFWRSFLLYILLSLALLLALLIFLGLNNLLQSLPQIGFLIIVTFILQQVFSIFRSFHRLVYYSSQMILFQRLFVGSEQL